MNIRTKFGRRLFEWGAGSVESPVLCVRLALLLCSFIPVVDSSAVMAADTKYDAAAISKEFLALDKVKFIDKQGKTVIPSRKCESVSAFHDGLARFRFVESSGEIMEGFIDKQGNWAIAPTSALRFESVRDFSEGLAAKPFLPSKDEPASTFVRFGYIDSSGKYVISPKVQRLSDFELRSSGECFKFSDGLALVRSDLIKSGGSSYPFQIYPEAAQYSYIDRTGKTVLNLSDDMEVIEPKPRLDDFPYPMAKVEEQSGLERECMGSSFSNGLALIKFKGKYGFLTKNGTWLASNLDDALPFSEGLAYVRRGKQAGFIDTKGNMVIRLPVQPETYPASFHDGLCRQRVKWSGGTGGPLSTSISFIDRKGSPAFKLNVCKDLNAFTGDFYCGLARVRCVDGKYGYINKSGVWKIAPQFENAEDFHEGISRVSTDDNHNLYIDENGRVVWNAGLRAGTLCSNGLIGVWTKK